MCRPFRPNHRVHAGVQPQFDVTTTDGGDQLVLVIGLAVEEPFLPGDKDHTVVGHQRQRIFDTRVAAAHYDNALSGKLLRIVKVILHTRMIRTRHIKLAHIALQADGEDDKIGRQGIARGQRDAKNVGGFPDARHQ